MLVEGMFGQTENKVVIIRRKFGRYVLFLADPGITSEIGLLGIDIDISIDIENVHN